ncbi:membrane protein [Cytophagales bacterium WSM2-2]|nr:membrane protein [Cytophagales bacterium WSM2-2]
MEHTTNLTKSRIQSVDVIRGAVMIIMAIDHVRVYSGIPAGGLTVGIFFTRWVTHFCAPAFAFLAGTSALLYLQKSGSKSDLAKFLVTRGLLLVIFELTFVRFFWMFHLDYALVTFTGVIWMLGWSMVILAAFIRLRPVVIGVIGLLMIFFQQVFSYVSAYLPDSLATVWQFFYPSAVGNMAGAAKLTGIDSLPLAFGIRIFYVLIPWVGVMMAGYWFGELFNDREKFKKYCYRIGGAAIALFIIGSIWLLPEDDSKPVLFRILGQQKYPPSQLYLLMTLGPTILLMPLAEKIKGEFMNAVRIIGQVPMFYYLLHLLLIHITALGVNLVLFGGLQQEWYTTIPFIKVPEEQQWGLPMLYFVWILDVAILFFACRWYASYKSKHPEMKWLKYI